MKRALMLLSIVALVTIGCSKAEKKPGDSSQKAPASSSKKVSAGSPEKEIVGKWSTPTAKGFVAEFKSDRTGVTTTANPANPSETADMPFKWSIESDGRVKIMEGKRSMFGKLTDDKKLEVDFGDSKTVLEKAK